MSVREAVESEIAIIRRADPALADSVYAASALALAQQMDADDLRPVGAATLATELRQTMNTLRELIPEGEEKDAVDELREQREKRRAGGAGA